MFNQRVGTSLRWSARGSFNILISSTAIWATAAPLSDVEMGVIMRSIGAVRVGAGLCMQKKRL